MGSSIAWHLKSDPNFAGQVTVIERDPSYARASSALSASSIRQQFSTPLNIHLSRYGIGFLRRAPEILGIDLGLKEPGYLFLASQAGEAGPPAGPGAGAPAGGAARPGARPPPTRPPPRRGRRPRPSAGRGRTWSGRGGRRAGRVARGQRGGRAGGSITSQSVGHDREGPFAP